MKELIPVDLEEVRKYWHPVRIEWSGNATFKPLMWHTVEPDENGWPMVKKTGIPLKGFKIDKSGKLVRDVKLLDLCTQLKQRKSNKITVKKPVGR